MPGALRLLILHSTTLEILHITSGQPPPRSQLMLQSVAPLNPQAKNCNQYQWFGVFSHFRGGTETLDKIEVFSDHWRLFKVQDFKVVSRVLGVQDWKQNVVSRRLLSAALVSFQFLIFLRITLCTFGLTFKNIFIPRLTCFRKVSFYPTMSILDLHQRD